MKLYDRRIEDCLALLAGRPGRRLAPPEAGEAWPDSGEQSLILRSEMAYELGGGALPAISGLGLTSSRRLVNGDEIWLYGQDLPELRQDSAYARLTFLRVAEEDPGSFGEGAFAEGSDADSGDAEAKDAYASIRKLEYSRYQVNPKGYMMRISAAQGREPVRVGREALAQGLDFAKAGGLFLSGYHRHPRVLAVKLIFITLPDFPFDELASLSQTIEEITKSLDHILGNLKMDCAACQLKQVCDEVEGLRELHFSQAARGE